MKDRFFLPCEGQWYKANLHAHTTCSDGALSPTEVKQAYREKGYAIVAFTDHWHYGYHPRLADSSFLPIAAFEFDLTQQYVSPYGFASAKTWHLNFYDTRAETRKQYTPKRPDFAYGDTAALNAYIANMNADGFLACYNHPGWSLQTSEEYTRLAGLFATEVYNHNCEQERAFGYEAYAYDDMLRSGHRLHCLCTDDNHNGVALHSEKSDSFGGYSMFKLPALSYEALFSAMREGAFYASAGPEIEQFYVQDDVVHIKTSCVNTICFSTAGRHCAMWKAPHGSQGITEGSYAIREDDGYVRVTIEDACGKRAFTNAVYVGDHRSSNERK